MTGLPPARPRLAPSLPVDPPVWHAARRAQILREHPELRALFGHDARSAGAIVALVVAELALAVGLARASWLLVLLVAYLVGALLSHALGVLIHEAGHNLVARGNAANKVWSIVANLPLVAPAAIEFRAQHLLHHKFLGEADGRDTQAPTRHEARVVGASAWRKLVSFTFGRFFFASRPANHVARDAWWIANLVVQVVAMGALVALFGWKPLAFLTVAALAAFGPHPTGARRLSEHLPLRNDQPTYSYYGALNHVSFNVGYHVEHHDFPAVPWTRVKALRALAASHYDELASFRSWTSLLARYVTDPRYRVEHYVGMGPALDLAREARHDDDAHARAS